MEWWDALAGVPGVGCDPASVKAWTLEMQEMRAQERVEQAEKERDEARETNTYLNRRLTKAEGALSERIEDAERKGHSIGRALANAGYYALKERIATLEAELAASRVNHIDANQRMLRVLAVLQRELGQ